MMKTEHTPTPWMLSKPDDTSIQSVSGYNISTMTGDYDTDESITMEANAALIVRAVNSHDDLVNALEEAIDLSEFWIAACDLAPFRAALAKAKGAA